jgi:hypothetical protein
MKSHTPPQTNGALTTMAAAAIAVMAWALAPGVIAARQTLPDKLSDQEFWRLSEEFSEPNGSFRSDNLVSNELAFPSIIPGITSRVKPGGVYMGVGPEQNFHYITVIRPKMAFITDVRRGNLHLHLMYKALFEMSADRAEFVARLLTKTRPASLGAQSSAADLMNTYWDLPSNNDAAYKANLQAIDDQLVKKHGLPLSKDDLDGIEYVFHAFYWFGPSITYSSSANGTSGGRTTWADLMMSNDGRGNGSFLATEQSFAFLKDFETRNLLVPVVGNFAGPKALRAVGQYVRDHGAIVAAYYLSNVEQYLTQDGIWTNFCANVATMPLDASSTFIRGWNGMSLGAMASETAGCR